MSEPPPADLFAAPEIEHGKQLLHALFQDAILGVHDSDPAYSFWWERLKVTHGQGIQHDAFVALDQYADELEDWLALNYPTKHWRGTGIFTRIDHILSAH